MPFVVWCLVGGKIGLETIENSEITYIEELAHCSCSCDRKSGFAVFIVLWCVALHLVDDLNRNWCHLRECFQRKLLGVLRIRQHN